MLYEESGSTTPAPLRVAFVGVGDMGHRHADAYRALAERGANVKLVACCDLDAAAAASFAQKYGITAYASIAEMKQAGPDIVSVCTPPVAHHPNVMELLSDRTPAGILCEKPPALTDAQLTEMCTRATERDVVLTFGFHLRFSAIQWLRAQVDAGDLGEIYGVRVEWMRRNGIPTRGVFLDKQLSGGGAGMDLLPHGLDLALDLLGDRTVLKVTGTTHDLLARAGGILGNAPEMTVEDTIFGTALVDSGDAGRPVTLQFGASWDGHVARPALRLEVLGTLGGATLELVGEGADERLVPTVYRMVHVQAVRIEPVGDPGFPTVRRCYTEQVGDLVRVVEARRAGDASAQPRVMPGQAATVLRTVIGAYESARNGGNWVELG